MRLGVLFSGGKDSTLALHRAAATEEVVCLVTVFPDNPESFFFHTPNLHVTRVQAQALGLPQVTWTSQGVEEREIEDLKAAIEEAVGVHGVEGIVSGAVGSVYQATRVQRVCAALGLWCFNPLWQMDQLALLDELMENGHEVLITGVSAPPLDEGWLGRVIDRRTRDRLAALWESHGINPAGEGGEMETAVLDAPLFRQRIVVESSTVDYGRDSGVLRVTGTRLVDK